MFKEHVSCDVFIVQIAFRTVYFFSDANHFNDTWLQKIRTDAADNYRIKVINDTESFIYLDE